MHPRSVGSDGEFDRILRKPLDDLCGFLPHQGLSPCKPDLANAHSDKHSGDGIDLIDLHEVCGGLELHQLIGHAVRTPEIAGIRQGNPEVIVYAVEAVFDHE